MESSLVKRVLAALMLFCGLALSGAVALLAQDTARVYRQNQSLQMPVAGSNPESLLGEAFDSHLKKLEKVFGNAPSESKTNLFGAVTVNIDDDLQAALMQGILAKAGIKPEPTKRYAIVRMYRAVKSKEVPLGGQYKGAGKLVASKVLYGHAVTVVLEGDSAKFTNTAASRCLKRTGDIVKEATARGLKATVITQGLQPKTKGTVPSAIDIGEFERRYQLDNPEPIALEYTVLGDFSGTPIHFADARLAPGTWRVVKVNVEVEPRKSNNSHWDPLRGKPDLIVTLMLNKSIYATSSQFKNAFEASWNCATQMKMDKGQIVQISVTDKDPTGDDYMGAISIETDKIFNYEPGQEIYLTVKDENSSIKSATILFERVKK